MYSKTTGKLIVISAPSGAGKTTIVHALLSRFPQLKFSVSATSRPMRGEEIHGKDYYFFTESEFKEKIEEGAFVEFEEVYPGQYYGTLKSEVERLHNEGFTVIFDVDVVGGLNIKKLYRDRAMSVFIQAPNVDALEKRLRFRSTESEEKILMRIGKAKKELAYAPDFDKILVNDVLRKAIEGAEAMVKQFLNSD